MSERGGDACGKVTPRAVEPSENGVSRAKSRATCGEALRDPSIPGSRCPVSHGARDETPVRLSFPAKSRGGRGMRTGREWGRADFFRFFRDFSRDRTAAHPARAGAARSRGSVCARRLSDGSSPRMSRDAPLLRTRPPPSPPPGTSARDRDAAGAEPANRPPSDAPDVPRARSPDDPRPPSAPVPRPRVLSASRPSRLPSAPSIRTSRPGSSRRTWCVSVPRARTRRNESPRGTRRAAANGARSRARAARIKPRARSKRHLVFILFSAERQRSFRSLAPLPPSLPSSRCTSGRYRG